MSFPRYQSYKNSGVEWFGEVPKHWQVTSIRRVASRVQTGTTPTTAPANEQIEDGVAWYSPGDFRDSLRLTRSFKKLSSESVLSNEVRLFPSGSVLIVSIGATLGKVGFIAETSSANQQINAVVPNASVDGYYLTYALSATAETMKFMSNASTIGIMNQEKTKEMPLVVPPLEEQLAIAAFLDGETAKIDQLVQEQQQLIELLGEKRQAVISDSVTKGLDRDAPMKDSGVAWLGRLPEHWDCRSISSISSKITNGYVGPTRDILVDEGVRYLQSLHIKGNSIRFDNPYFVRQEWSLEHSKSILDVGDVLIVQTGDIGQVAVVSDEFAGCNCHALIIVAPLKNVIFGEWLSWVLNSDYGFHSLLSIQTGALHPHLNCGNVKSLMVPVPPLEEQKEIVARLAERLAQFDALISEAQRGISLLQERRAALIAAAVTGKIDVRGVIQVDAPIPDVVAA